MIVVRDCQPLNPATLGDYFAGVRLVEADFQSPVYQFEAKHPMLGARTEHFIWNVSTKTRHFHQGVVVVTWAVPC